MVIVAKKDITNRAPLLRMLCLPLGSSLLQASARASGGGAYYFAKRDINARWRDHAANNKRVTEKLDWQERVRREQERMDAESATRDAPRMGEHGHGTSTRSDGGGGSHAG
ncbi:hypothetical protein SYNPS1DRAFT_26465 [Syncephalis pseudoplumigaleata]|uniref:Uncharacterized protein n=1 Tax=Syncephalis pseudoplumigaleata TaxID=1712513 RepID=A0A4P9Z5J9_9FUNG|nr:hypothetical protein SYNPS1DRAFT_26465 [Syncephalis pseudoplumigaleata]|eukprot:RKP27897.1 hypothetical protein SYNPS1DRAFT_26465 [Syncephalis pseudoplumigaleata]